MLANETELQELEVADTGEKVSHPDLANMQKRSDDAFLASGVKTVGSEVLKPYSASREVAAQAMGLHYGYIDEAGQERYKKDKIYPGAIRDVAVVMWLCIKATEDEVDAAGINPKIAVRKAVDWAKAEGLMDIRQNKFWDAYLVFFQIMDEVWASQSKIVKKNLTSPT